MNTSTLYEVPCPKCGQKFSKPLSELEGKDNVPCPHCGKGINFSDFKPLAAVEDAAEAIRKEIQKLNRRFGK